MADEENGRGGAGVRAASGGTLFVVATPIGNLGDITMRALETLRAVPLIAAEDTRVAHRLLSRYEIATRTTSFHARSTPARLAQLLAHLRDGADLALVTDAGTPVVSDPGGELISAWLDEAGRVVPIPGPSSVLAAVAASGVAGPRWSFEGFLPRSGRERRDRLTRIAADERATVLFEAPSRLAATLRDLATACGAERRAAVCRELTKLHEQILRGTLGSLREAVASGEIPVRGEIVLVVRGADREVIAAREEEADSAALVEGRDLVESLVRAGHRRSAAVRRVAGETGLRRRDLYDARPPDRE